MCDSKSIWITVTNRSSRALRLDLSVQPYQETINGGLDTDVQHKLMWLGSLTNALPELAPHQSYAHELALCFISAGRFNFQVFCRPSAAPPQTMADVLFDDEKALHKQLGLSATATPAAAVEPQAAAAAAAAASAPDRDVVFLCHKPLVVEAMSDATF